MVNRQVKKCLTSLVNRVMQIKTTIRYHFTWVRMAIMRSLQIINAQKAWSKGNSRTLLVEMEIAAVSMENIVEVP